ncbi:MAG: sel1 repeat family protein [Nitrospirota bacterium]|nr:sel1 repeat family protein [Nitrospirota bacterium]MDH5700162.1 sel1 repeat family protein [Nitrospirota bacterium]
MSLLVIIQRLVLIFLFCWVGEAWAGFEEGEEAYLQEDFAAALSEWRPLAEQGNAEAQNMLGYMYRYGQGVTQDFEQARLWYRRAADLGNARAQNNLGALYRQGLGVLQDYQEAFRWFLRAAEQGNGGAQNHVGLMYYQGEGVQRDLVQAYMWAYLAAKQGLDPSIQALDFLAKDMTPAQIDEAKSLAGKWKPKGEEVAL